jgi:hypothetical protein
MLDAVASRAAKEGATPPTVPNPAGAAGNGSGGAADDSCQTAPTKTGWPAPELAQDDCRGLFRWFASRPDARRLVRINLGLTAKDLDEGVDYFAAQGERARLKQEACG